MKILICDDDGVTLKIMKHSLEARGHSVVPADNAIMAVNAFDLSKMTGEPFDLIITDQEMVGHSGFYVCGHVRANGYKGRLAVYTGYAKDEHNLKAMSAEYWPKDEGMNRTLERVEE